ncbi:MAG: PHP domain-containing protein [Acidobacteriota bacterium]
MPPIEKRDAARALNEISRYMEIVEENRFKSLAFRKAAAALEELNGPLGPLVENGEVERTPGIGKTTARMIAEMAQTGSIAYLDDLRKQFPPTLLDLARVPGMSWRKVRVLYETMGIATLEELEKAAREDRLKNVQGFGKKTQENIIEGVEQFKLIRDQFHLYKAVDAATAVISKLESLQSVSQVVVSGAVRRRLEVVEEIVICACAADPAAAAKAMIENSIVDSAVLDGTRTVVGSAPSGIPVRVYFCEPDQRAVTLFTTTGSEAFLQAFAIPAAGKGVSLTEGAAVKSGKPLDLKTEEDLFAAVAVPFVEPELREDGRWLGNPPARLVRRSDLQGAFHVHSTYSDGRDTLRSMLAAAAERGFVYVGMSEHSKFAGYAGGLSEERLREAWQEIDQLRPQFPSLRIFRGTEADILQNGDVDYGVGTLAQFDFVIASIHNRFKMDHEAMTERILRALENPWVTFLGHLTGRKLLSRDPYSIDFDRIFETAARNGVMIEINGSPHRLDIDWRLMQRALDMGVRFSINPDAHSTTELDHLLYGSWHARKGGLVAEVIFNTRPPEEVEEYFVQRRKRAAAMSGLN